MKPIKYYENIIFSMSEIEGHPLLLVHALTGCMFHCYKCFNYEELIEKKHEKYYTIDDVLKTIERQHHIIDYILFSGGEFLLAPLESLIHDLKKVRAITDRKIIIYTTGFALEKMKVLVEKNLVDGFHIDMKLPYHLLTIEDLDLIEHTMGIRLKDLKLIKKLMDAIEFVVQNDRGLSQVRSVKYPFLDESAFVECKSFIDRLNRLYNRNIPYFANRFLDPTKGTN